MMKSRLQGAGTEVSAFWTMQDSIAGACIKSTKLDSTVQQTAKAAGTLLFLQRNSIMYMSLEAVDLVCTW